MAPKTSEKFTEKFFGAGGCLAPGGLYKGDVNTEHRISGAGNQNLTQGNSFHLRKWYLDS